MAKQSPFDAFCKTFQIKLGKPATSQDLAKVEKKIGFKLADSVRSTYLQANGGKAKDSDVSSLVLNKLSDVMKYAGSPAFMDSCFGLWPLLENKDSDPVCVACKGPLAGYVVLVSHDDGAKLMFRSLDRFFQAAIASVADGQSFESRDLPTDFDTAERTSKDLAASKKLLKLLQKTDELTEEESIDVARFACDLLPDSDIVGIKALLKIDNTYVREHVTARLSRLKKSAARKAVKKSAETFDSFVINCAKVLKKAGIAATTVEMYGKPTIRLDPGPVWLNMQFFHSKRKQADFEAMLLEKVKEMAPKKKKK